MSGIATCRESRTESPFVARESAFGLGSLAIFLTGEAVVHHSSVPPQRWPRRIAWVDRNRGAADTELFTAQRMVVLRVVAFVGQNPSGPEIGCGLSHRRNESRRVLGRTLSRNDSDNQLASGVKDGGQLWPRSVCYFTATTPSQKVLRCMPSLQPCGINRRSTVSIVSDQPTDPTAVAASREKSFEPPFSRSFCSTCQSVE